MTGEQHPIPALTPPNCHLNSAYNKCQVLLVSHPAHNPPKSLIYLQLSGNFMGFMSAMLIISTAHFGGTVHTVTSNFTSVIFPSFTDSQENTAAEASQEPKM